MTCALITGGLGLIGTFIGKQLIDEKIVEKVVCLDHFGRYSDSTRDDFRDYRKERVKLLGENLIIERGEAKHLSIIYKILRKYKPKYVFHLAALPLAKIDNLSSEEAIEGSVISTSNLIESIKFKILFNLSIQVIGDNLISIIVCSVLVRLLSVDVSL